METKSERLFEQWCAAQRIGFDRVPEDGGRVPDYAIHLAGLLVVAEVKQIEPTQQELFLEKLGLEGSEYAFAYLGPETQAIDKRGFLGWRVRPAIVDAVPQLKARAGDNQPAVVVIYNNSIPLLTDDENMMAGIHGAIEWKGPLSPTGETELTEHLGGGRALSAQDNRTVSAVWLLLEVNDQLAIDVFHNRYARTRSTRRCSAQR